MVHQFEGDVHRFGPDPGRTGNRDPDRNGDTFVYRVEFHVISGPDEAGA